MKKEERFRKDNVKTRYESFGGIVGVIEPPMLAWVDKEFMRELGCRDSPLWRKKRDYLTAPLEVHFSLTNRCPLKCQHCYTSAGTQKTKELTTNECKAALRVLSKLGVFHIAFGGGECFVRKDIFEIAHYCRGLGMVPNVTTNGYYITKEIARKCRVFGRINVSLDGTEKKYKEIRGVDGFEMADRAVALLTKAGNRVGINSILCSKNFAYIAAIVDYAKNRNLENILFLRFKPVGRGKNLYNEMRLTNEQHKELFPLIKKLQEQNPDILFETDCSFLPMVCFHNPSLKRLRFFAVGGCVAGNILLGTLPDGLFNACSICSETGGSILELSKSWDESAHLKKFREWTKTAKEPCKSCKYLECCKGGCHVIAKFVTGDFHNSDPECPFVIEYCKRKRR